MKRRFYVQSGLPPSTPRPIIASIPERSHVRLAPTRNQAPIYLNKYGSLIKFRKSVPILLYKRRWYWYTDAGLVPLVKRHGKYFLKGH